MVPKYAYIHRFILETTYKCDDLGHYTYMIEGQLHWRFSPPHFEFDIRRRETKIYRRGLGGHTLVFFCV